MILEEQVKKKSVVKEHSHIWYKYVTTILVHTKGMLVAEKKAANVNDTVRVTFEIWEEHSLICTQTLLFIF
jgi:hypothetical protein